MPAISSAISGCATARHYMVAEPDASDGSPGSRTILYTPTVSNNPGQIAREVQRLCDGLRYRLGRWLPLVYNMHELSVRVFPSHGGVSRHDWAHRRGV
jgi:hypothetical protein